MKKRHVWFLISLVSIIPIMIVVFFEALLWSGSLARFIGNVIQYHKMLHWSYYLEGGLVHFFTLVPEIFFGLSILLPLFVTLIIWAVSIRKPKAKIAAYIAVGLTVLYSGLGFIIVQGTYILEDLYEIIYYVGVTKSYPWYYIFYYFIKMGGEAVLTGLNVTPLLAFIISLFYIKDREPIVILTEPEKQ